MIYYYLFYDLLLFILWFIIIKDIVSKNKNAIEMK